MGYNIEDMDKDNIPINQDVKVRVATADDLDDPVSIVHTAFLGDPDRELWYRVADEMDSDDLTQDDLTNYDVEVITISADEISDFITD